MLDKIAAWTTPRCRTRPTLARRDVPLLLWRALLHAAADGRDRGRVTARRDDARSNTSRRRRPASGSSFYYAFLFLPPPRRAAITAFYAFCREVDDVVDEVQRPRRRSHQARLVAQRGGAGLRRHAEPPGDAGADAAHAAYAIEPRHLLAVIEGCEMDLEQNRYLDFAGLARYCHLVAGIVGEVAATSSAAARARRSTTHTSSAWRCS